MVGREKVGYRWLLFGYPILEQVGAKATRVVMIVFLDIPTTMEASWQVRKPLPLREKT